eukprot:COSAG01_NODE_6993_length_3399_cov_11.666162_3_plen_169_part_00
MKGAGSSVADATARPQSSGRQAKPSKQKLGAGSAAPPSKPAGRRASSEGTSGTGRNRRSRRIQIPRELRSAASLRAQAAAEARWSRPKHLRNASGGGGGGGGGGGSAAGGGRSSGGGSSGRGGAGGGSGRETHGESAAAAVTVQFTPEPPCALPEVTAAQAVGLPPKG